MGMMGNLYAFYVTMAILYNQYVINYIYMYIIGMCAHVLTNKSVKS
jgi:hypothetical protein